MPEDLDFAGAEASPGAYQHAISECDAVIVFNRIGKKAPMKVM